MNPYGKRQEPLKVLVMAFALTGAAAAGAAIGMAWQAFVTEAEEREDEEAAAEGQTSAG